MSWILRFEIVSDVFAFNSCQCFSHFSRSLAGCATALAVAASALVGDDMRGNYGSQGRRVGLRVWWLSAAESAASFSPQQTGTALDALSILLVVHGPGFTRGPGSWAFTLPAYGSLLLSLRRSSRLQNSI